MKDYTHVIRSLTEKPWAVLPETLATIADIVRFRASGGSLSQDEIRERVNAATANRSGARRSGAVAVLPLQGVIFPKANLMTEISGGTTVERFRAALREVLADDSIGSILIDVDSPGGMVDGVPELAEEIRAARGSKPIVAISDSLNASAAYWLSSQADELVATPSSLTGAIGVYTAHTEYSAFYEAEGIRTTLIAAGKYKVEGNEYEPLSEEARTAIQERVDDYYGLFVAAVAAGRGVSATDVRNGYGQGRVLTAKRAKAAGLVDRVATFDETIRRLATGKGPAARGTSSAGGRIQHYGADGQPISTAEAIEDLLTPVAIQGGDAQPADDPEAHAFGEAGTPPDVTREAEAALALARAQADR